MNRLKLVYKTNKETLTREGDNFGCKTNVYQADNPSSFKPPQC
ncbi:hypothetical protein SSYIS1_27930 [Serratia symbiotica]|uniref:Uncharacterized protein n=1 Tax=Serratia symbiotica TaxID=138074 RepID=A0A455VQB3_9GAMM|nr:hypothetical protein SSYIS1_27930 [Serratia symbiotica]